MSSAIPLFPKIPNYRREADLLHALRSVSCLEKLDGAQTRLFIPEGAERPEHVVIGSRSRLLGEDAPLASLDDNLRAGIRAHAGALERCLRLPRAIRSNLALFGETIGRSLNAGGHRYSHRPLFVLFAASIGGTWLSPTARARLRAEPFDELPSVRDLSEKLEIPMAPLLYEGPPEPTIFDALVQQPSAFARAAGRGEAHQEGIVIWSDPLLLDSSGLPLVAKLKDPKSAEVLDRSDPSVEPLEGFAERVVRLERLRHARQHLTERGTLPGVPRLPPSIQGDLLAQRVVQDVAREIPEYQDQLRLYGKKAVRVAIEARVVALLPMLALEDERS